MHWRRQMLGTCPGATWYPILEGECDMRVPQVSERIKEAPAQALRGVFAGIGQLLLITDKLRNKASHQDVPRARTSGASETVTDTTVTSPAGRDAETAAAPAGPAATETAAADAAAAAAPAAEAAARAAGPAEAVADGEAVTAEAVPAKPASAGARRTTARPTADKPVTAKPPAKPAAAKPAAAKPVTPRRTAAKAAAAEAAGEAAPKPPKRQSSRNFDKTGNVRLLGDEADSPAVSAAAPTAAAAEPFAAAEPVAAPAEPVAAPDRADRGRRRRPSRLLPPSRPPPSLRPRHRCPTTTNCRWHRSAPGCATSTSRRSGSSRSTSGRTPPGPMC